MRIASRRSTFTPCLSTLQPRKCSVWASGLLDPQTAYWQHPEFAKYEYKQFRDRLNDYRKKIREKKKTASFEAEALARDRLMHPKPTHDSRGEPRWEGSEAERLLKIDVAGGKHKDMEPKDLRETSGEYKKFSLTVFRKHIYQAIETRKFHAWLETKRGKKKT